MSYYLYTTNILSKYALAHCIFDSQTHSYVWISFLCAILLLVEETYTLLISVYAFSKSWGSLTSIKDRLASEWQHDSISYIKGIYTHVQY